MCESTSVQVRKRVKAREKKKSEKRGKREKLKWEYVRNERFSDELFKASNPATPLEAFLLKGGGGSRFWMRARRKPCAFGRDDSQRFSLNYRR